jgi:hypothetical protein
MLSYFYNQTAPFYIPVEIIKISEKHQLFISHKATIISEIKHCSSPKVIKAVQKKSP